MLIVYSILLRFTLFCSCNDTLLLLNLIIIDTRESPNFYCYYPYHVYIDLLLFVSILGRRCRSHELMFPSFPTGGFSFLPPYLCVFSDTHIDVFNVHSGEWIQTLYLKKVI